VTRARFGITICITTLALLLVSFAGAQDVPSHVEQIIEANSLDVKGKTPFHLKISFQLYDLQGKPTDTGTVEEWWAGPGASKTLINAQSLNSSVALPFDAELKVDPRENYLVSRLLAAESHPIAEATSVSADSIHEAIRSFDKVNLNCLTVVGRDSLGNGRPAESFCVDPKDNALRVQYEGNVSTTVRNSVGVFHGTSVSLDLRVAFEGRLAITGKVTTLQQFDPAKSEVVLPPPIASKNNKLKLEGGVTAGKILSRVAPEYPSFARSSHIGGTVVLHAVITKQGRISNLFPIASPSPTLTGAAMEAVKQWTYSPYLLNGEPTDIDTVINVNFRVNGS
jgi:TonB family protein